MNPEQKFKKSIFWEEFCSFWISTDWPVPVRIRRRFQSNWPVLRANWPETWPIRKRSWPIRTDLGFEPDPCGLARSLADWPSFDQFTQKSGNSTGIGDEFALERNDWAIICLENSMNVFTNWKIFNFNVQNKFRYTNSFDHNHPKRKNRKNTHGIH